MTLDLSDFKFRDPKHGLVSVRFRFGDRPSVQVYLGRVRVSEIANHDKRYRPCVTHCQDVIRLALKKPPKSNHAAQRLKAVRDQKPLLRIIGD